MAERAAVNRSKIEGLRFAPNPIECPACPPTGCDLTCVWPGEKNPVLWEGDDG